MNYKSIIFFLLLVISNPIFSVESAAPLILPEDKETNILVNNRVLTVVGNKPITVMDVMKKMDMIFYKQYPQYTSSKMARFQFYQMTWKKMLEELIDKELLLADAEESKLEVTSGDVRQEMEDIFSPSIISNLDKAGLTMDEAWQMIHDDIVIRRMLIYHVNAKAMQNVNPHDIREAYSKYIKEYHSKEKWVYQVISIRHPDEKINAEMAEALANRINKETLLQPQKEVENFKQSSELIPETQVTISDEFQHQVEEIADNYKEILKTLANGSISIPIPQKNRKDNSTFYRIFYLKEKISDEPKSFDVMANILRNKLIQEAIAVETDSYLGKLRTTYGIKKDHLKEAVPEDFQPFLIKMSYFK